MPNSSPGKQRGSDVVRGEDAPERGPETCFTFREATIGVRWVRHRYAAARHGAVGDSCVSQCCRASAQTPQPTESATQQPDSVRSSPLAIHVGDADLLFGGFIDATRSGETRIPAAAWHVVRTIPFGNTVQGHMNDTQFSSQNSRLTLQATPAGGAADLKGSLEVDFLGNAPNGLNVTTNSNTLRMRVFWGQYRHGAFEFLAGQAWSLMTPNPQRPVAGDSGRVLQPDASIRIIRRD